MNEVNASTSNTSLEQALDLLTNVNMDSHPLFNISTDIATHLVLRVLRRQASTMGGHMAKHVSMAHEREDAIGEVFMLLLAGQTRWGQHEERDGTRFLRQELRRVFRRTGQRIKRAPLGLDAPKSRTSKRTMLDLCEAPDPTPEMNLAHARLWGLFQEGLLPIIAQTMGKSGRTTKRTVVQMLRLCHSATTLEDLVQQHHPTSPIKERRKLTNRLNKRHQRTRDRLLSVIDAAIDMHVQASSADHEEVSEATLAPRVQAAALAFIKAFAPTLETLRHLRLLILSLRMRAMSVG